jgi:hypothetical protein
MEKYKYPGYVHHRKEHDAFVERSWPLRGIRAGKVAQPTCHEFPQELAVGHFKGTDRKYAPFHGTASVNRFSRSPSRPDAPAIRAFLRDAQGQRALKVGDASAPPVRLTGQGAVDSRRMLR